MWISDAFGSVQPPVGEDGLRDAVSSLLIRAEDVVAQVRIAVRRSEEAALRQTLPGLRRVLAALSRSRERLR